MAPNARRGWSETHRLLAQIKNVIQLIKMLRVLFIVCFLVISVNSDDGKRRDGGRQGRFFSFNVIEEDVRVDLAFNIPFLNIPVKKTMNSAYGLLDFPTININPASLALGGAIVLGTSVVIPFLLKSYIQDTNYRYARIFENAEFSTDAVLDFANQMLSDKHGFRGCPLRVACWTAQLDFTDQREIMNQIVNNRLLSSIVNSSAVEDAMISGKHGRSCSSYGPCPLQDHHLPIIMRNLAAFTNMKVPVEN